MTLTPVLKKSKTDLARGLPAFPGRPSHHLRKMCFCLHLEVTKEPLDGGARLGKSVIPMLVGCIAYHYSSSNQPHHTGFIYALSHTDDPGLAQPATVFFGIGKNIPKDKLSLQKVGQFAD